MTSRIASLVAAAVLVAWILSTIARAEPQAPPDAGFARAPIRLSPGQRQAIGLTYGAVERRAIERKIRAVGRLEYDERKLAEVTLKVRGWVQELFADTTGKEVRKGEPLFTIYSPDLVSAQQEYLLALRTADRLKSSNVPSATESASSLVQASRERLRLWDLGARELRELEKSGKLKLHQTIRSPVSGVVVERTVVKGRAVEPGMTLYRVADLSTIWVHADVYEYDLPFVHVGQEGRVTLSYYPDAAYDARITTIYPEIDPKTRTAKVRFELENGPGRELRPQMFANVELRVPLGERLVVAETAVLDAGRRQIVFVDAGGGEIAPREVRVGIRAEGAVEILQGLTAGERVVTSGNFLVDSESKLAAAESMMGMMGAIGMGDWKMESARPMEMGGKTEPQEKASSEPSPAAEEKKLGDLLVAVFPAEETAEVGEGALRARVRDTAGNPVTGARVRFAYTMDMPGMTIEQAPAKELGDGVYEGKVKFTMAGPWGIVVEVQAPGKPPARGKFTVRVAG